MNELLIRLRERLTDDDNNLFSEIAQRIEGSTTPVPMILWCPQCRARHIDRGDFATKPHHTHACQKCGHVWRPAIVATVGVQFLPGFKDEDSIEEK